MNNRRSFLKDTLVILCASLLPKILRPAEAVIEEEFIYDGIIPTIERMDTAYYYMPSSLSFKMVEELIDGIRS